MRYGTGDWQGLHSNCVITDLVLPMCAPSYLEELRAISDDPREQLRHARLIDSVKAFIRWNTWLPRNAVSASEPSCTYRLDRSSMSMRLAIEGAGVLLDSTTIALEALISGRIVPLSSTFDAIELPAYWMVCPARHTSRRSVRLFSSWITEVGQDQTIRSRSFLLSRGFSIKSVNDAFPRNGPIRPEGQS